LLSGAASCVAVDFTSGFCRSKLQKARFENSGERAQVIVN
jgi:hypothetical protein